MADRGFDIEEDLPIGVTLNIQPFLNGKSQLDLQKELETRRIDSVYILYKTNLFQIKFC